MELKDISSTAVAVLAVVISLVTYVVTNRRDNKKWQRDQLLEAMGMFLDGSFARYGAKAFAERHAQLTSSKLRDPKALTKYEQRATDGLRAQNAALTRLRLLAPVEVIAKAEDLMVADEQVARWFNTSNPTKSIAWDELNSNRQEYRAQFIDSYRKQYRLGPGKSIGSGERNGLGK